ncbi:GNAT family N-acetyltransferase [Micromonospora zamorensis]|uniref:GNAT family N-acetyltransferase n=1 Tax=Micromonospora zamorensis TaxID=709883 RepID=UPI0037BD9025
MTEPSDLTPLAEGVECEFMYSYESRTPEPAYTDLGIATTLTATVGEPAWRPYAAWDDAELVAGGNLFLHDGAASLNAAATAPGHRGLGAQSALIAARARAAAEAGCQWLFAETGKPAPGTQNPSLNNMRRAGLVPLYERRNWVRRSTP